MKNLQAVFWGRHMNRDLALAREFMQGDGRPLALDASPLQRALKGEILQIDAKRGCSVLAFEPGAEFVQGGGVIQGGIVATMLDFALAFATLVRLQPDASVGSVTLTVNFMRPALPGRVIARGKIVRMGARLVFAEADIGAEESDPIATATSVIVVTPLKS